MTLPYFDTEAIQNTITQILRHDFDCAVASSIRILAAHALIQIQYTIIQRTCDDFARGATFAVGNSEMLPILESSRIVLESSECSQRCYHQHEMVNEFHTEETDSSLLTS